MSVNHLILIRSLKSKKLDILEIDIKQGLFFPPFIFISWRLITLQLCSGFCRTLTWISHGFMCSPSRSPLPPPPHPIPLGHPSAPSLSNCLMHPTWTVSLIRCQMVWVECYLHHLFTAWPWESQFTPLNLNSLVL